MFVAMIMVPAVLVLDHLHMSESLMFVLSLLAILPLASLLPKATEEVSEKTGPVIGGLLNATAGNLTELAVVVAAASTGHLNLAIATVVGSAVGNFLLVGPLAMIVGGITGGPRAVKRRVVSANLPLFQLIITLVVFCTVTNWTGGVISVPVVSDSALSGVSLAGSVIVITMYALTVAYQLFGGSKQNQILKMANATASVEAGRENNTEHPDGGASHNWKFWLFVLFAAGIAVGLVSEVLVSSFEPFIAMTGIPESIGAGVLIPIAANAIEHLAALQIAAKREADSMNQALSIAFGSGNQVLGFGLPLAVIVAFLCGFPPSLALSPGGFVGIVTAFFFSWLVVTDGEVNSIEGGIGLSQYGLFATFLFF